MINIQKLKDEAFSEAIDELKEEMSDDPEAIKRLDSYKSQSEEKRPHLTDADKNTALIS
tara:strand:+ start:375 stop:551 length:177 start_codon:yes stop_codon:yes gene_type:complete